jgi:argininosuccinate synthase
VTGTIRLKLFKGDCRIAGRKSDFALAEADVPGPDDLVVDSLT